MSVNVIVGSCGLIGREVSNKLSSRKDLTYFLDLNETNESNNTIKIDVVDFEKVNSFLEILFEEYDDKPEINIIYLAARDAKLGENWQKFENFNPALWDEYSTTNQTALLNFVSRTIKMFIEKKSFYSLQFILFPSMYNYLGPDQRAYSSWPDNVKPFEYIGSKALTRDLNKYINSTYGHLNIRSNCIVPHLVTSDSSVTDQGLLMKTLTTRGTKATEVAEVVEFLIKSPKNLVGQEIFVDGGWMNK